MAAAVREIERKYDLAADGTAALDSVKTMAGTAGIAAVSRQDEQFLGAVYYDTADLRLIGAGIALRRVGGGNVGWHLKLQAAADTRDEVRLPLAAPGGTRAATSRARTDGAVPEELAALVRAYARGAALAPVVRIQTRRRVLRLLDGDFAGKARAAGEDTFTYGLIHQRQACQAATIEQALPRFTAAQRDRTTGY